MFFYLTTLKLSRYPCEEKPILLLDNIDPCALARINAWEHGNFLCNVYIKSRICDYSFTTYIAMSRLLRSCGIFLTRSIATKIMILENSVWKIFKIRSRWTHDHWWRRLRSWLANLLQEMHALKGWGYQVACVRHWEASF